MRAVDEAVVGCGECPRLRTYCEEIGRKRRRAYANEEYWVRPVPGFGPVGARILILGLAPGAHGANRTGRMFTGDRSGDFLFPVLHEAGMATKAEATSLGDGLRLLGARITAVVHCAPPGDKPTAEEYRACARHLAAELDALARVRVVVCLGRVAWEGYLREMARQGVVKRMRDYPFAHGAEFGMGNGVRLLGSYHPSLRNTNTGVLTRGMLLDVFIRAVELAGS